MTDSDKIPFAKLMGELFLSFGRDIDHSVMAVYFKHLMPLTFYQVTKSVEEIINKDDRFPNLSRVKALASIKKHQPPEPMRDVEQIEEVTLPSDLPRTKEAFFDAMRKLHGDVDPNK